MSQPEGCTELVFQVPVPRSPGTPMMSALPSGEMSHSHNDWPHLKPQQENCHFVSEARCSFYKFNDIVRNYGKKLVERNFLVSCVSDLKH